MRHEVWAICVLALSSMAAFAQTPAKDRHGVPLPEGAVARLGSSAFLHPQTMHALALSPNSQRLAVLGYNELTVWDIASRQKLKHFALGDNAAGATQLRFSRDGKLLVTLASMTLHSNPVATLWDWEAGKEMKLVEHAKVRSAAFAPDGKLLALADDKGNLIIWDLPAKKELRRLTFKHGLDRLAFADGGATLRTGIAYGGVQSWDVATLKEKTSEHERKLRGMRETSDDGAWVLAGGDYIDSEVRDAATDKLQFEFAAVQKQYDNLTPIRCVLFGGDSKTLLSRRDNAIQLWDIKTGKEKSRVPIAEPSQPKMCLSQDGKLLAVAHEAQVRLYDLTLRPEERDRGWNDHAIQALTFSPDGKVLAASNINSRLLVWDVTTAAPVRPPFLGSVNGLPISHAGRKLRITYNYGASIEDCDSGEVRTHCAHLVANARFHGSDLLRHQGGGGDPDLMLDKDAAVLAKAKEQLGKDGDLLFGGEGHCVIRSPGGRFLLLTNSVRGADIMSSARQLRPAGAWTVCDARTGMKRCVLVDPNEELVTWPLSKFQGWTGHEYGPLAFSPDDRLVAWRGGGDKLFITDMERGRKIATLKAASSTIVAFAPDGKSIACASGASKQILLCETGTGEERARYAGHDDFPTTLSFSPDGSLLASGAHDATILLWDTLGSRRPAVKTRLTDQDLADAWTALGAGDAKKAHDAAVMLAQHRAQAIPGLRAWIAAIAAIAASQGDILPLIKALDSPRYPIRHDAETRLRQLSSIAAPTLEQALKEPKALESRRRIELLLSEANAAPTGAWLQAYRGLELLERIGATDALEALSKLEAANPVAIEARVCLERAKKHRAK